MGNRARVTSLEALDAFASALRVFQDEAARALESVEMNVRAAVDCVRIERKEYWNRQLRRSEQQTHEAKLELQRCQIFRRVDDYRPTCIEEKRRLERSRRRLDRCREQIAAVGHWSRVVDRAANEYKGGVNPLVRWLEVDVERAVVVLGRVRRTLLAYVAAGPAAALPTAGDSLPPAIEPQHGDSKARPPAGARPTLPPPSPSYDRERESRQ